MTVRNATELVILVENTLGWVPDPTIPLWQARMTQAARLNKAIKKDPERLTWRNLELAVEYLRRRRQTVTGVLYVTYVVDDALKLANPVQPARPLADLVAAAIAREKDVQAEGWDDWVTRLVRARGDGRKDVHDEWLAAGRG